MKNNIIRFFSIIALSLFSLLPVNAQERGLVRNCPKCTSGTVSIYTTRTYEHDEIFPCTHGYSKDYYAVYEIKTTKSCDSCDYYETSKTAEHVFLRHI